VIRGDFQANDERFYYRDGTRQQLHQMRAANDKFDQTPAVAHIHDSSLDEQPTDNVQTRDGETSGHRNGQTGECTDNSLSSDKAQQGTAESITCAYTDEQNNESFDIINNNCDLEGEARTEIDRGENGISTLEGVTNGRT